MAGEGYHGPFGKLEILFLSRTGRGITGAACYGPGRGDQAARLGGSGFEVGARVAAPEEDDGAEADQPDKQPVEMDNAGDREAEADQQVDRGDGEQHGACDPGPVLAALAGPGQPEPDGDADQAGHDETDQQGVLAGVDLADGEGRVLLLDGAPGAVQR